MQNKTFIAIVLIALIVAVVFHLYLKSIRYAYDVKQIVPEYTGIDENSEIITYGELSSFDIDSDIDTELIELLLKN